ncbi:MAG: hypothetical protein M1819_005844 [Sarea resinae]|nr:MAG: hypothetical protein M1819_005844 [Sarea resinae]
MEQTSSTASDDQRKADHLCVLVHGLWGNPQHLSFLASSLREKYSESELHILVAKRNSGSFTYDGIELGGERVTQEIEDTLESLARDGQVIKKLSIVGYSLGGLVARYAIGLLHSKGWFEKITPVNFTTFASPHLGVRTPLLGFHNHLWNVLGARTLSMSGRQLFTIDSFRNTGRPLLSILADPDSIFIHALAKFQRRTLYANVVNDRSAVYYTTGISKIDPFADLKAVKVNYVKGYEPIIVDPDHPVSPQDQQELPTFYKKVAGGSQTLALRLLLLLLIPLGSILFLINSAIQSIRSQQRIRLHEEGKAGIGIESYRMGLMVEDIQSAVEGVFEDLNNSQSQEYLPAGSEEVATSGQDSTRSASGRHQPTVKSHGSHKKAPLKASAPPKRGTDSSEKSEKSSDSEVINTPVSTTTDSPTSSSSSSSDDDDDDDNDDVPALQKVASHHHHLDFPTLALAPQQFSMIQSLDRVGFRKYPVYIHQVSHSHAAIIVRMPRRKFEEGKVVIRHWLEEEFLI